MPLRHHLGRPKFAHLRGLSLGRWAVQLGVLQGRRSQLIGKPVPVVQGHQSEALASHDGPQVLAKVVVRVLVRNRFREPRLAVDVVQTAQRAARIAERERVVALHVSLHVPQLHVRWDQRQEVPHCNRWHKLHLMRFANF